MLKSQKNLKKYQYTHFIIIYPYKFDSWKVRNYMKYLNQKEKI